MCSVWCECDYISMQNWLSLQCLSSFNSMFVSENNLISVSSLSLSTFINMSYQFYILLLIILAANWRTFSLYLFFLARLFSTCRRTFYDFLLYCLRCIAHLPVFDRSTDVFSGQKKGWDGGSVGRCVSSSSCCYGGIFDAFKFRCIDSMWCVWTFCVLLFVAVVLFCFGFSYNFFFYKFR